MQKNIKSPNRINCKVVGHNEQSREKKKQMFFGLCEIKYRDLCAMICLFVLEHSS